MGERPPLVLASASPRRRVLLSMLSLELEVIPARIDEAALADGLDPMHAVMEVARAGPGTWSSRVRVVARP